MNSSSLKSQFMMLQVRASLAPDDEQEFLRICEDRQNLLELQRYREEEKAKVLEYENQQERELLARLKELPRGKKQTVIDCGEFEY